MNFDQILESFSETFLSVFTALFLIQNPLPNWEITENWIPTRGGYSLTAESKSVPIQCKSEPNSMIQFPIVILGTHKISLDGNPILSARDPAENQMRSFFGSPRIECSKIMNGRVLSWQAFSYSRFCSILRDYPRLVNKWINRNFFSETIQLIAACTLPFLALFILILFWGRLERLLPIFLLISLLSFSAYFACTVSGILKLPFTALQTHRIANLAIWIGFLFLGFALRSHAPAQGSVFLFYEATVAIGLVIIVLAKTINTIQFGTLLPFTFGMILLSIIVAKKAMEVLKTNFFQKEALELISFSLLFISCANDVLINLRIMDGYILTPVGLSGSVLFFSFAISKAITQTYLEHDRLQCHLEILVKKRTQELELKSFELNQTAKQLNQANEDLRNRAFQLQIEETNIAEIVESVRHELQISIDEFKAVLPNLKTNNSEENQILVTASDRIHQISDQLLNRMDKELAKK